MKIKSISEHFFEYFVKNESRLEKDYPGIKFNRFIEEYCDYDHSKPSDEFFMENPAFLEKIRLGVPLEYINFKSFFYKEEFYVNSDVLIPRSETEILCEKAIEFINKNYHEDFTVYDIGTGSGVIPLTIAIEIKKPLNISACDISQDALAVANINYDNLFSKINNKTKINFEIRDRLDSFSTKVDLITSNPPYIKEVSDKGGVHHQADSYEPHMALYLKDAEYDEWFDTLFKQVNTSLKEKGLFIMEGHEDHLGNQKELAQKYFNTITVLKDYTQRDRFLLCQNI